MLCIYLGKFVFNTDTMKHILLSGWNFMRVIRLALGVFIIVQAFVLKDALLGILGFMFSGMALFNMGCCGTGGCAVPMRKAPNQKEVNYEEVTGQK